MPNRILRDWTDSFKFEGISSFAEVLFNRLIMKADDFGRYHAHPQLVKSGCFPLAKTLRANTVAAWLTELSDRRLVFCYKVGDRELLAIVNFRQRIRDDVNPKFPSPPGKPERWVCEENEPTRRYPPRPAALGVVGGVVEDGGDIGVRRLSIFALYPRKVGKPKALKAIEKAMLTHGFEHVHKATKSFAKAWDGETDLTFCPHPATWFNQERYNDDPSTWKSNGTHQRPTATDNRNLGTGSNTDYAAAARRRSERQAQERHAKLDGQMARPEPAPSATGKPG